MLNSNARSRRFSYFPLRSIFARRRMARRLHPEHFPILHCSPSISTQRNESCFFFISVFLWSERPLRARTMDGNKSWNIAGSRASSRPCDKLENSLGIHTLPRPENICKQERASLTLMAAVVRAALRKKIRQKATHKACFYAGGVKQRFTAILNPARPRSGHALHPPPAAPYSTAAKSIIVFVRIIVFASKGYSHCKVVHYFI